MSQGGKKQSRDEAVRGLYGLDLEAGDRFELPMHLAYETGVVAFLPAIFGAPRQNRTAITGLQNQCTAIVLVGRNLQDVFDRLSIARWILARCLGLALSNIFVS